MTWILEKRFGVENLGGFWVDEIGANNTVIDKSRER
jgi:hypothetical protein